MSKVQIGYDEWKSALAEVSLSKADVVPKGWITAEQGTHIFKCAVHRSREHLNDLLRAGKAEQKKFAVLVGEMVRPINHYRLKK